MDSAIYTALSRQSGLKTQMDIVANNIANASTTGFRREGLIFSEYVKRTGDETDSLSMVRIGARNTAFDPGQMTQTGGSFDLAIDGVGFFQIRNGGGLALSRAGHFFPNAAGQLVNPDGLALLDAGGTEVTIPPGARDIAIAGDGTLSADGQPVAQLGLWKPTDINDLTRIGGNLFTVAGDLEPADGQLRQGFLEGSNVNPIHEVAKLIEVQRRYESARSFLDKEDRRISSAIQMLGK